MTAALLYNGPKEHIGPLLAKGFSSRFLENQEF